MFESLESRRLMTVTADAFHNTLYVWGDANGNGISVDRSGTTLVVSQYVSGSGYVPFFSADASYDVQHIRIYGYAGPDTISIADNVMQDATVYGGPGADWIKAGGGDAQLWGHGNWADDPSGAHSPATDDNAGDTLIGGKGYNQMSGQGGNDSIFSSMYDDYTTPTSYDMMFGGEGNDELYPTATGICYAFGQNGNDILHASPVQQTYFYGGNGWDTASFGGFSEAAYIKPDGATWSGPRADASRRHTMIMTDVEQANGSSHGDYFSGSSGANAFWGGGGNDVMYGNGGNDSLIGEGGNDSLHGGDAADYLLGGDGNDQLWGDAGSDNMFGGNGNDSLHGGDGNDRLSGDANGDSLWGDAGNDTMIGGTGSDHLFANDGQFFDSVYGDNQDGSGSAGYTDTATIDAVWIFSDFRSGVEVIA